MEMGLLKPDEMRERDKLRGESVGAFCRPASTAVPPKTAVNKLIVNTKTKTIFLFICIIINLIL